MKRNRPHLIVLAALVPLATVLLTACGTDSGNDHRLAKNFPGQRFYTIPGEVDISKYIVVDDCGAVWYVEVHGPSEPAIDVKVLVSPCCTAPDTTATR